MNRRLMLKQLSALTVLVAAAPVAFAQKEEAAEAEKSYVTLKTKIPADRPDKIEVIEFFHYGCPHCREFDPLVERWLKTLPEDVAFQRVPVIWGEGLKTMARLYYAVETTKTEELLHNALFRAIQDDRVPLNVEATLKEWLASKKGVDVDAFMAAYKSFGVDSMVKRAEQISGSYKVDSVPMMAVNGEYTTSSVQTGSHALVLKTVDQLIVKVRAARKA